MPSTTRRVSITSGSSNGQSAVSRITASPGARRGRAGTATGRRRRGRARRRPRRSAPTATASSRRRSSWRSRHRRPGARRGTHAGPTPDRHVAERLEDLAGQPGRAHPRLDDAEDARSGSSDGSGTIPGPLTPPSPRSENHPVSLIHPHHRWHRLLRQGLPRRAPAQPRPQRLVIFSRDELKQYEMRQLFGDDPRLRFFIGDIRDRDRLNRAMHGVDYVVHAAALKQVDTAEYNPFEYVKTNILGSQNVIDAAHRRRRQEGRRALDRQGLQPDQPLRRDQADRRQAVRRRPTTTPPRYATRFSVVRYGNVMGSRGSVIPFFRQAGRRGQAPADHRQADDPLLDHPAARPCSSSSTRFDLMHGGELYVPRIPSMKIVDLAEAIAPGAPTHEIGIRPGEKLHEEMIAAGRQPPDAAPGRPLRRPADDRRRGATRRRPRASPVPDGFTYRSDTNDQWLSADEHPRHARHVA